jgi:uroporphyrinogen decarboxylase
MNNATIMSPTVIRDIFVPLIKQVNALTEAHGMIPFFHCCGNIWAILDDFVAAGYKGYQSIQETAGMDTRLVKEKYGDVLTLWTGIQCETLVEGTMEQAEEEVRQNLEFLMPGGGFIFGSTNSVQYGAKTDNYLKALEVVRKYGAYR